MSSVGWPEELQTRLLELSPEDAVQCLLDFGVDHGLSDLFLLTGENQVQVAARHLGILRFLAAFPADFGRHCMGHIKALAGMDVTEHRHPADGRWLTERQGRRIDLRISTPPTLYGEDFTLRFLGRDSVLLQLDALGLLRKDHNELLQAA